MPTEAARRVLVVANRTGSTPALLAEIERRAGSGARFALLIPPEAARHGADWSVEEARRLVERAAGTTVEVVDGGTDAALTVHRLVDEQECDEIILSTVHHHLERWRHHDLAHRIGHLGVPVTVIPPEPERWGPVDGFPEEWVPAETPGGLGLGG
jgi:hypothetical protein